MSEDYLEKYKEYKEAQKSGISNKERYKLLAKFVFTNPSDVDKFIDLLRGKKQLNKERNRFCLFCVLFACFIVLYNTYYRLFNQ